MVGGQAALSAWRNYHALRSRCNTRATPSAANNMPATASRLSCSSNSHQAYTAARPGVR